MNTHIDKLILKEDLKKFHGRSDSEGIFALFKQYASLIFFVILIVLGYNQLDLKYIFFLYPILAVGVAGTLWAFYPLMHEAIHQNLFKNKKWNNYIGELGAFLIFEDVDNYRNNHKNHHSSLATEHDPESDYENRWQLDKIQSAVEMYVINFLTFFYTVDFLKNVVIPFFFKNTQYKRKYYFWAILIVFFLSVPVKYILLCYIIPILILYPYITFLSVVHEHILLYPVKLDENNSSIHSFANTRNNIHGWINKYILHPFNDGFHAVHHFDSAIPFYNLAKAHEYLKKTYNVKFEEESFWQTIHNSYAKV